MTGRRDERGTCLGYALTRAEQITGKTVRDEVLVDVAVTAAATGVVPDTVAGLLRIEPDEAAPGDVVLLESQEQLHATVVVAWGVIEDQDQRGKKRYQRLAHTAKRIHSAWRLTG